MYSGGFYPYDTLEEYWAWWSRQIYINRYDITPGRPYRELRKLITGKDYFVLTTNVDHQFQLAGFDKKRLFTPKATMACGNAPGLATGKPTTMRTLSVKWSPGKRYEDSHWADSEMSGMWRADDHESSMRRHLCPG